MVIIHVRRRLRIEAFTVKPLADQVRYIARENPAAARRAAARIRALGNALGEMAIGRPGRVAGVYELVEARLPYVIAYAFSHKAGRESVVILRVIHTRRDWPDEEWPR
ncbi:MAG: type II toxin-antitoxin system RelE/ParE family toxin [Burkholderiaceae bacterium]|nr:type II toxin-antitoxin system RelE/ParE family toxin [Burkholderiaceae bacterium]